MGETHTVLVVDDEPAIVEFIQTVLLGAGHTVHTAGSVASAAVALKNNPIDVAFVDVMLGQITGIELVKELRKESPSSELRIIMMSGYGTQQMFDAARECGADAFITKPFDAETLLQNVTG